MAAANILFTGICTVIIVFLQIGPSMINSSFTYLAIIFMATLTVGSMPNVNPDEQQRSNDAMKIDTLFRLISDWKSDGINIDYEHKRTRLYFCKPIFKYFDEGGKSCNLYRRSFSIDPIDTNDIAKFLSNAMIDSIRTFTILGLMLKNGFSS